MPKKSTVARPKPAIMHAANLSAVGGVNHAAIHEFEWRLKEFPGNRYSVTHANLTNGIERVIDRFTAPNRSEASKRFNSICDGVQARRGTMDSPISKTLHAARERQLRASGDYRRTAKELTDGENRSAGRCFELEEMLMADPDRARMLYNKAKLKDSKGLKLTRQERLIVTVWETAGVRNKKPKWAKVMVDSWPEIIKTHEPKKRRMAVDVQNFLASWYQKAGYRFNVPTETAIRKAISREKLSR